MRLRIIRNNNEGCVVLGSPFHPHSPLSHVVCGICLYHIVPPSLMLPQAVQALACGWLPDTPLPLPPPLRLSRHWPAAGSRTHRFLPLIPFSVCPSTCLRLAPGHTVATHPRCPSCAGGGQPEVGHQTGGMHRSCLPHSLIASSLMLSIIPL